MNGAPYKAYPSPKSRRNVVADPTTNSHTQGLVMLLCATRHACTKGLLGVLVDRLVGVVGGWVGEWEGMNRLCVVRMAQVCVWRV